MAASWVMSETFCACVRSACANNAPRLKMTVSRNVFIGNLLLLILLYPGHGCRRDRIHKRLTASEQIVLGLKLDRNVRPHADIFEERSRGKIRSRNQPVADQGIDIDDDDSLGEVPGEILSASASETRGALPHDLRAPFVLEHGGEYISD